MFRNWQNFLPKINVLPALIPSTDLFNSIKVWRYYFRVTVADNYICYDREDRGFSRIFNGVPIFCGAISDCGEECWDGV